MRNPAGRGGEAQSMRLTAAAPVVLALALVAGCSAPAPAAPAGPGPRVLQESQVRVFTDRALAEMKRSSDYAVQALAENPDQTGGMYGSRPFRAEVEEKGRAVCSHMIAGETGEDAIRAAYPKQNPRSDVNVAVVKYADQVLCPAS